MARCNSIAELKDKAEELTPISPLRIFKRSDMYAPVTASDIPAPKITERRIDNNEMLGLIFGKWWKVAHTALLCFAKIPNIVAYVIVFGASFAANVPLFGSTCNVYEDSSSECHMVYMFWALIFCGIVTVLTLINYEE
jgi:hypothetical protein